MAAPTFGGMAGQPMPGTALRGMGVGEMMSDSEQISLRGSAGRSRTLGVQG